MNKTTKSARVLRFESFEVNLRSGELHKDGVRVRLPEQSFRILSILLERPGEVVPRQEIRQRLWPNDTVVEFENSINAAVKKLRLALGDSADSPRYIETLARRGYRWTVPVEQDSTEGREAEPTAAAADRPIPEADRASLIGKKVAHYRVLEVLGGGGMGVVYKAEDIKLGRRVALKFLPEELSNEATATELIEREARAASALNHPNICTIYEVEEYNGQPFIVMELLEGQTLAELINSAKETSLTNSTAHPEFIRTEVLLDIAIQIAEGLSAAHGKSIIHRDIKPANVFVTVHGQVKILDFGLAKRYTSPNVALQPPIDGGSGSQVSDRTLNRPGIAVGTAAYMSPEQVRGEQLDERTDLFSFGLVIYEMATGQQPFRAPTGALAREAVLNDEERSARDLNPEISPKLESIIHRALQKDRARRYQSAAEMSTDLKSLKQGEKAAARFRVHPAIMLGGFLAVLLVVAGVTWFAMNRKHTTVQLKQRQLTTNSSEEELFSAAISPNGKYLAYSDLQGIKLRLVESGETQVVSSPDVFANQQVEWQIGGWFPDGTKYLATAGLRGHLLSAWIFPLVGGQPLKLRDNARAWSVSPDGSAVALTMGDQAHPDQEIWLVEGNGQNAKKLFASAENWQFNSVVWSPNGRRLAYDRFRLSYRSEAYQHVIETRDLAGGDPKIIVEKPGLRGFTWLADGRVIYSQADSYESNTCNLWETRVDPNSGDVETPLQSTNWSGFCESGLTSTANNELVFLRSWARGTVYVADLTVEGSLKANPHRRNLSDSQDAPLAWTPDNKNLIFVSDRNGSWGIYREPLPDGPAKMIASGMLNAPNARLSPDGNWIIYEIDQKGKDNATEIMRVPVDGGVSQQVLEAHYSVGPSHICAREPSTLCVIAEATPDRKQIVFTAFDPGKGRGSELLRYDTDPSRSYTWNLSPDGTQIAIVSASEDGIIHILPLTGQKPRDVKVRNWKLAGTLGWTADSKGWLVDAEAPGGLALIRVNSEGEAKKLWQQASQPVGRGSYSKLYSTWGVPSPDGRHIAILGWTTDANAWMIQNF